MKALENFTSPKLYHVHHLLSPFNDLKFISCCKRFDIKMGDGGRLCVTEYNTYMELTLACSASLTYSYRNRMLSWLPPYLFY